MKPQKQRPGVARESAPAKTQNLRAKSCPFRDAITIGNGGQQ